MDQGADPFTFCGLQTDAVEQPQLTAGMVAAAFRRVPLPASRLVVQPANGRTLVNFATNFYTDSGAFAVPAFRLLGHVIELRVRPVEYLWDFGDGATRRTSGPGAPYPELEITHEFQRRGPVSPRLDTTYAATYRVDRAGPWRPVSGTVTVPGTPVALDVLTATPTLVGYE